MLSAALQTSAEEHIDALAARHHITVRRSKEWATSEADFSTRQVFIPRKITRGIDYFMSLHEIGHIVDHAVHRQDSDLMVEAAASVWALNNANPLILRGFTKTDWRRVGLCWASFAGPVW